jgi:lipid biosynthesis B12-binding/radical SAM protein
MKFFLLSANVTTSPYPIYPVGMGMIAAALTSSGHEVLQADFLFHDTSLEHLGEEIRAYNPDFVGISVRNIDNVNFANSRYYIDNVKNIVDRVREVSDAKVLLGGAGYSLLPEMILRETGADYGFAGEGERLIIEFAANAAQGIYPENQLIGPAASLDGPDIASALYDERLMKFYLNSGSIASVQTKRGCTYNCVYCTYPLLEGRTLRSRDPREVVNDIKELRDRFNAGYIFFVDSVFNDDDGVYLAVVDEMLRQNISMPWTAFIKPGGLSDEIVQKMKRSGFAAAEVGADAACDTTLKKMGKSFSFQDVVDCNDLLVRNGIAVSHFFMFGGPGETVATVEEGISNILALEKCVSFIFMGIRILPNTPLARIAVNEKVISPDDDLLHPVYYISPAVDSDWLQQRLTEAFADRRNCLFPPDSMDNSLQILHKLGYTGPMWDLLLKDGKKRERTRHA